MAKVRLGVGLGVGLEVGRGVRRAWLRPLVVGALVVPSLCLLAPSCLVAERCYGDEDCSGSTVCTASGRCLFECSVDSDCDATFGVEFICSAGHCERAAACTACSFPHAEQSCIHGDCRLVACHPGYYDRDGDLDNGCEFHCEEGTFDANGIAEDGCECTPTNGGEERCNGIDDDCDGSIDEDFALEKDPANCGTCGRVCNAGPHAIAVCGNGQCLYRCEPGFYDSDGDADNGCEAAECIPTTEVCNGRDDDCDCPGDTNGDGITCGPGDTGVDEGFNKNTVEACGPYCVPCIYAHGQAMCSEGQCELVSCEDGYLDLDGRAANGCEYACTVTGEETCNGADDDCDGLVDEGDVCAPSCPPEMVAVGTAYCIDRYEASRPDATATSQGTETGQAFSRANVLPWMVNPMTSAHLGEFEAACAAAGKHLCTKDEWFAACAGPGSTPYVYGATFDREACNCVDTFCDDFCEEQGLASCSTESDCGYSYGCFHEVATGTFPSCTNDYGTFDMNGNVWEIVPSATDPRGYEVRGGAFNCAGASTRVSCEFNANWTALYAGFRCCTGIE